MDLTEKDCKEKGGKICELTDTNRTVCILPEEKKKDKVCILPEEKKKEKIGFGTAVGIVVSLVGLIVSLLIG